jgi:plasmid stability protein
MKRMQIQLDERTYEKLRRRAFEKGCSVSSYVREVLAFALATAKSKQRLTIGDFKFVGAGSSRQGRRAPVSERHDEALVEVLAKEHRR